ncbi:hypothetical protein CYMTET_44362 [Cymbomonas tetramitiformis]|uniref:Uncharacterized protein n=1 Tax=Cymbomonas tetramitiformis TaxID=36881 RepID=A0AAE0EZ56_9CHLO|nr:hypothetical protein CYMTET_44362 [Cymbomonas tetramitiformis]|eukprot:gene25572-31256_t
MSLKRSLTINPAGVSAVADFKASPPTLSDQDKTSKRTRTVSAESGMPEVFVLVRSAFCCLSDIQVYPVDAIDPASKLRELVDLCISASPDDAHTWNLSFDVTDQFHAGDSRDIFGITEFEDDVLREELDAITAKEPLCSGSLPGLKLVGTIAFHYEVN